METFRIFCIYKKRTKPEGWFDHEGEPEHFSRAESGGQSRCPPTLYKLWRTGRSHFFLLYLVAHLVPLLLLSFGRVRGYTPAVAHCKNTTCTHDISQTWEKSFRIFCIYKKRTKPEGWFDHEGEPEHFSKAESGGQSRLCFLTRQPCILRDTRATR